MAPRDIAVAGCGPAGLTAALLLHRDGHRVTLFERFAAARPIGSGLMLQPTGLAVLRTLGLEEAAIARGARIDRLVGEADGRTVLDVRYASLRAAGLFGVGIHRAALFDLLHGAVQAAGIAIAAGHVVTGSSARGGKRHLALEGGDESSGFDLVVDALGSRSPLAGEPARPLAYGALWATLGWCGGFDRHALQQRYRRASTMAGVLPIGRLPDDPAPHAAFFWSLRGDRFAAWQQGGLAPWKREVLALWPATAPLLDQIADPAQLTFARYAHRTLRHPAAAGLIHIGDAWHATSPQLGQGANMALLDAYALAHALRGADNIEVGLEEAVALRRGHVRLYQAMSRWLTPVYQSDGTLVPLLRDRLVGPVSRLGPVNRLQAGMVSGLIGRPLEKLGLA